ncbi:hypothetical protein Q75_02940 [Bacillus coahuilensis p1.1.43]|uniref:DNRLRE domain-containing protein n=1 Tax=Bacillus coahuilensis p1.1.43 TaxID=1150625 RepID=A0A147KB90_9BACI|nr:DNRLRE domain-containing protein [Bacillus coahuilensis]KUP08306.1 hypothetical protein Q75_02940 [Bacillus coahuilensis p1.1.43]
MKKDHFEVSWSLKEADKSKAVVRPKDTSEMKELSKNDQKKLLKSTFSIVDYFNVKPNVDLNYHILPEGIKENIIIQKPIESYKFEFELRTKGLIAELNEFNELILIDESDPTKEIFFFESPYMFDANGELSKEIKVKLKEKSKGKYVLTIKPNENWMLDPARAYPITIDPTIKTSLDRNKIYDSHVSERYPSDNFENSYIGKVGEGKTSGKNRNFYKFTIPTLKSGDMVINATLGVHAETTHASKPQVNVHKVTKDWNEKTITWNNQPTYDTKVIDYEVLDTVDWHYFDVTSIVKDWYTTGKNYGLMLKNEVETSGYTHIYSADINDDYSYARPQVIISYINNSGLESYWSYHSHDIGRAGTGHVNDYNGNLVLVREDASTKGSILPMTVKHVFNSNDKDSNIGFGYGWRLNVSQTIKKETIDGKEYFIYTDGDGTKHYLEKRKDTDKEYKDESGLNITLKTDGPSETPFYLTDRTDNTLYFYSSGKLRKIIDQNKNEARIIYSGNKIVQVVDGAEKKILLDYDTNNNLKTIKDTVGRVSTFNYTSNELREIIDTDGEKIKYEYHSNHKLKAATDFDGYSIQYEYHSESPYRVKNIKEVSNNVVGNELAIDYSNNETTFKDSKGRKLTHQFNHQGNTISVKDNLDQAQYYKFIEEGTNKNHLSSVSKLQKTSINLLQDHSFEKSNTWDETGWTGSSAKYNLTSSENYFGKKSAKLENLNGASTAYFQQRVDVVKGKTYTLSGYVKADGVSSDRDYGAGVFVRYKDEAGTWYSDYSKYVAGTKGWQRVEVTFKAPNDHVYVRAGIVNETGAAYFDGMQLEESSISNRYNMLENPDFSIYSGNLPMGWNDSGNLNNYDKVMTDSGNPSTLNNKVMRFLGEYDKRKFLYQELYVNGKKGDNLIAAGWGKGYSVPLNPDENIRFNLEVGLIRSDGSFQWKKIPFNPSTYNWQYISDVIIAEKDYERIRFYIEYYHNENQGYFDGLQLYREEFDTSYQYDNKGNVISTQKLAEKKSQFEFDSNNDLIKTINPSGFETTYVYDDNHNIKTATTAGNVTYHFDYTNEGNPKKAKVGSDHFFIQSSSTYTASGEFIDKVTDAFGNVVDFIWNESKGELTSLKDANGYVTNYEEYDAKGNLEKVSKTVDGNKAQNIYIYENDNLKTINHNEFNYHFDYDKFGRIQKTSVENQMLIQNYYEIKDNHQTGRLDKTQYGNNQYLQYQYDTNDRLLKTTSSSGDLFSYEYDSNGNMGRLHDYKNQLDIRYYYDLSDKLIKTEQSNGLSYQYGYDLNNNLSTVSEVYNNKQYSTSYNYDRDNRLMDVVYSTTLAGYEDTEVFYLDGSLKGNLGTNPVENNALFESKDSRLVLEAFNYSTNLLKTNVSLESGMAPWASTDWNNQTGKAKISKDAYTGNQSIMLYDSDGKTDGSITNVLAYQWYDLPSKLTSSKKFTLSAYAKRVGDKLPALSLDFLDQNGNRIAGGYSTYYKTIPENEWTRISQTFTAPVGSSKVRVMVRSNVKDQDKVWFDGVQLEEKSYDSSYTEQTKPSSKNVYNLGLSKKQGTMSIEFKTMDSGTIRHVVGNEEQDSGAIFNMYLNSSNKLVVNARNSSNQSINIITTNESVQSDRWYSATMVWKEVSGKLELALYLDSKKYSGSLSNLKDFTSGKTALGTSTFGRDALNGYIRQFAYSSRLWSDEEITMVHHQHALIHDSYAYDPLGRLDMRTLNTGDSKVKTMLEYESGQGGSTTQRVKSITNQISSVDNRIEYTYDGNGNIKTIKENGKTNSYIYNELNELTRENNAQLGKTFTYQYDVGGNLLSKSEYPYTTGSLGTPTNTISYTYDSIWKDKLLSYNGKTITYDSIGNPLSFNGHTYKWQLGDQLASMTTPTHRLSFNYNVDGYRTEKVVDGNKTTYQLDGDKVIFENNGQDEIHYTYNTNGSLVSMNLNGVEYFYIRNNQKDIIGLVDRNGEWNVRYQYDSWGVVSSIEDTSGVGLGEKNPYRYRGYRYDQETGLYYLNARYYNPEWGRMLNADSYGGSTGELLSHNVFAYSGNNPVTYIDPSGYRHMYGPGAEGSYTPKEHATRTFTPQVRVIKKDSPIGGMGQTVSVAAVGATLDKTMTDKLIKKNKPYDTGVKTLVKIGENEYFHTSISFKYTKTATVVRGLGPLGIIAGVANDMAMGDSFGAALVNNGAVGLLGWGAGFILGATGLIAGAPLIGVIAAGIGVGIVVSGAYTFASNHIGRPSDWLGIK